MAVEIWGQSFLHAIGNFFLNPLLYYGLLCVVCIAMVRIKKERKQFSVKIYDISLEFEMVFKQGLILGLMLSVLTLFLGLTVSSSFALFLSIGFFLLSLTRYLQMLTPFYILSVSIWVGLSLYFLKDFLPQFLQVPLLSGKDFVNILPLLAILLFAEGFLVGRYGGKKTSPDYKKSHRGGRVGVHISRKLWILPLFLLVPSGDITSSFSWWPIMHTDVTNFSLVLLPIPIGYKMVAKGMYPEDLAVQYAKRVYIVAWLAVLGSVITYFYSFYEFIFIGIVGLAYVYLTIQLHYKNGKQRHIFSQENGGIKVLDILSHTPADLMGIEKGEMIVKANGEKVETMDELYDVLSRNRAYVKLEVRDRMNEIRHVHCSFHEGDHHELGIIAVKGKSKYEGLQSEISHVEVVERM